MKALYPGSFDPFTNGHLSVLEQAVNLFDKVVICISPNPSKKRRFSEDSCIEAIKDCLKNRPYKNKVEIKSYGSSIPAEIAEAEDCDYIIRGIRNTMDYMYEEQLATFNSTYNSNIKSVYFRAENSAISSTMVYTLMKAYKPVYMYLPYDEGKLVTIASIVAAGNRG